MFWHLHPRSCGAFGWSLDEATRKYDCGIHAAARFGQMDVSSSVQLDSVAHTKLLLSVQLDFVVLIMANG